MSRFKALSIVTLGGERILNGDKTLEIRSWKPGQIPLYDLVLVQNTQYLTQDGEEQPGEAIAVIDIVSIQPWLPEEVKAACASYWQAGYWAWQIDNIRPLHHRPRVMAKRKIYEIDLDIKSFNQETG